MNIFNGRLVDHMVQARQAEKMAQEYMRKTRDKLERDGYRLVERTNMFERWKHPDGRETILE